MRHPYIISYKESFVDRNKGLNLCIVMDYADGGDLYTKIAKQR
jgi:NIMA (never in mitosis gene a)-related kinase